MLLNRVSLPEDGKLRSGNFYIPRLGQLNAAQHLPVLMSRFVAQYRASFDDEVHIPKRLELSEFGDLADHLHPRSAEEDLDIPTFCAVRCSANWGGPDRRKGNR